MGNTLIDRNTQFFCIAVQLNSTGKCFYIGLFVWPNSPPVQIRCNFTL